MTTKPLFIDSLGIMDDIPLDAPAPKQPEPLSVTALSLALKGLVETNFSFVRVRGEISGFKKAASGHMYMALKDEESVLDAVCWRGTKITASPEDGLEVICTGRITTYPGRSKYQIVIETMEAAGEGALLKLLEERRKKLEAEGLFAPEHKKKIPFLPDVIGVITSPTGAVIRDIMHRLNERFPRRVLLWPSLMQGEEAATQVAQAIKGFNAIPSEGLETPDGIIPRPDVLIVARGGGSLEDLWTFNEEIVVRATAESDIPLISAVGHETDTTLIDYASDLRAPTPTGAAEKAVPVREELMMTLDESENRLKIASMRLLTEQKNILTGLGRGLPPLEDIIFEYGQKLDDRMERLENAVSSTTERKKSVLDRLSSKLVKPDFLIISAQNALLKAAYPLDNLVKNIFIRAENRFETTYRLLDSFSYERVLERGFALVLEPHGKPVSSVTEAAEYPELTLRFTDGNLSVSTGNKEKPVRKKTVKKADDDKQGRLL